MINSVRQINWILLEPSWVSRYDDLCRLDISIDTFLNMPLSDQNIDRSRYQIIPRVLVFPFQHNSVLLLKLLPKHGKVGGWSGFYNGAGGHVERGEDLFSAARRELFEETGLSAKLTFCGTILVDSGDPVGIGLFVFRADEISGSLKASPEGIPEWISFDLLDKFPLVEDVMFILDKIRSMPVGGPQFSGKSFYDTEGKLKVIFNS